MAVSDEKAEARIDEDKVQFADQKIKNSMCLIVTSIGDDVQSAVCWPVSGSRDKGQVKLVAAKMKERAPAAALDDHHGDSDDKWLMVTVTMMMEMTKVKTNMLLLSMMIMVNVIDKSWTMTLAIYDNDDNCSDDWRWKKSNC